LESFKGETKTWQGCRFPEREGAHPVRAGDRECGIGKPLAYSKVARPLGNPDG